MKKHGRTSSPAVDDQSPAKRKRTSAPMPSNPLVQQVTPSPQQQQQQQQQQPSYLQLLQGSPYFPFGTPHGGMQYTSPFMPSGGISHQLFPPGGMASSLPTLGALGNLRNMAIPSATTHPSTQGSRSATQRNSSGNYTTTTASSPGLTPTRQQQLSAKRQVRQMALTAQQHTQVQNGKKLITVKDDDNDQSGDEEGDEKEEEEEVDNEESEGVKPGKGKGKGKSGVGQSSGTISKDGKRKRIFTKELRGMMYGFGDVANPHPETLDLMEDLVMEYIEDMTKRVIALASKRGKLQAEDLVFLIRKDRKKSMRVRQLLNMYEEVKKARKVFDNPEDI